MDPTLLNNLLASLRDTIFNVLTENGTPFAQLGLEHLPHDHHCHDCHCGKPNRIF